tara:strand:- start:8583 stop:9770 length:1188 start_codon:yes stop_codon:yes gene_type:complete
MDEDNMGANTEILNDGDARQRTKTYSMKSRLGTMFVIVGFATALNACTKVPDAINPVEWYHSTAEALSGDDAKDPSSTDPQNELQAARGTPAPGSDEKFPQLSQVDQQVAARDSMTEGLAADTAGRKYDDSIQRQGSGGAQNSLYGAEEPPAAPKVEASSGVPTPQPTKPVAIAEPAPQPTPTPQPAASATTAAADTSGVDAGMRDRLARQLAEIRARAADRGSLLPADLTSNGQGQPTVIVSSGGIETVMSSSMQASISNDIPGLEGSASGSLPPGSATRVATILFSNGSSVLDSRDRQILSDVARLQKQRGGTVHIVGHASQRTQNMDPVTHKMTNYQVSAKRAAQVADELRRLGISDDMVRTAAVGDNRPIYLEVMPSGEAGNRRTEIYLTN